MTTITKENAAHFLRAQIYLMSFTTDDIVVSMMNQSIEFILQENKELKDEIKRLTEKASE